MSPLHPTSTVSIDLAGSYDTAHLLLGQISMMVALMRFCYAFDVGVFFLEPVVLDAEMLY